MLSYRVELEMNKTDGCKININEYISPAIYLDIDELKWVGMEILVDGKMDIEIPAESRTL